MAAIISGKFKGRKFKSGKDPALRPTQGRVKKSMMQIMEPFTGLKVLDLFAGLGTLGIEALSRGAESVTFVELKLSSIKYLKKNILDICAGENVVLENGNVFTFLNNTDDKFDIVLADPPYKGVDVQKLMMMIPEVLIENGRYAVEMKKMPILLRNVRVKTYGSTQVVFG